LNGKRSNYPIRFKGLPICVMQHIRALPTGGRAWYLKLALLLLVFLGSKGQTITDVNAGLPREGRVSKTPGSKYAPSAPGPIWLVEHGADYEVYSNGLRIEDEFVSPNVRRAYVVFTNMSSPETHSEVRSEPAGIVFHTSESLQVPFTPSQNDTLTNIGRDLLAFVSRHHAYHFVIDRFGRIFRIVPETDVANHAGYSVWADRSGIYVNLNHCFLGISFEAHTDDIDKGYYLTSAQIHSGRLLVEMLVRKYKIPLANCVTHAQVSVDPDSMIIGHHTDGSGDFPFRDLGIPDNYSLPIPSLYAFGFDYDPLYLMKTGPRMWKGLLLADERLRREANSQHLSVGQYKAILRERYRTSIATLKSLGILKEN
jgi:hypothetical protein